MLVANSTATTNENGIRCKRGRNRQNPGMISAAAMAMLQLIRLMPNVRSRFAIATVFGAASGVFCWFLMRHLQQGAGDFGWAIRAAQDLLANRRPYARPSQFYPLPAAFFGLPFVNTSPELAGGIFYGLSTGLLAFGITRHSYRHLLIFMAYPYWAGMLAVQWIPFIMACAFFWWVLPATLAKPQIGLPIALTHLGAKGAILCLLTLLLSFLLLPHWLSLWLAGLGGYARFIPLLTFPGPLLALALLRYRNRDAWLLFLAACMPQRWFYDPFYLWLIPRTRRQIIFTVGLSWIPAILRWYHSPHSFTQVGRWAVLFFYLPMLLVLFLQQQQAHPPDIAE
jgi:hypothetical protein